MNKKTLAIALSLVSVVCLTAYMTMARGYGSKITFISGTEYQQGEPAQTIVRLTTVWGIPISANWCNVTIWYPDKTVFVDNQAMTQGGSSGSWYYSFTTPTTQIGVYEEYVTCSVILPTGRQRLLGAGSSFHVSQTLTLVNETSSAIARILS